MAMKAFQVKWGDIKENSDSMITKAKEFIDEFEPLIKYLDKLSIDLDSGVLANFRVQIVQKII